MLGLLVTTLLIPQGVEPKIQFSRDVLPILSENCFTCHGPSEKNRKAKLRFDLESGAFADLGGYSVIVRGDSDESELYLRLVEEDGDERMPPAKTGKKLTARQIELIKRWIDQGAKWQQHWSFIRPQCPAPPKVTTEHWPRNAVDQFILARLEREGLSPSPEASR